MQTEQVQWSSGQGWQPARPGRRADAQLVLVFGGAGLLERRELLEEIHDAWPRAEVVGCTTAGEIRDTTVRDDTAVATAVRLDHGSVATAWTAVSGSQDSFAAGQRLARDIPRPGLRHAFVLSDGLQVNGSALVRGLADGLPPDVAVTGGLSADGDRFGRTLVLWRRAARPGIVGMVGFYGERLRIGTGSLGGWDPFGPERLITRSHGNILHELDGRSALGLYKAYLGKHAQDLPASGLRFPLCLRIDGNGPPVVRTILSIDEGQQSMTFAGDLPEGAYARLMKANFDRLVDGAQQAARTSQQTMGSPADLAILISCVGRKLVLQQRTEEEVEAVRAVLGGQPTLTGFYSYGEISPFTPSARCELHNQTMTITTLAEAA